jgi:hypothetical protein
MCTRYLHLHPPTPFPHILPFSHWYQPLQTGPVLSSCSMILVVQDCYPGSFFVILPCIHYYNLNWFISSYLSPFYLHPLLMVISIGLKILYSFMYRNYINHIHLRNFFYPLSCI